MLARTAGAGLVLGVLGRPGRTCRIGLALGAARRPLRARIGPAHGILDRLP